MASTIRDVAAKTGLSLGTVSKYINGGSVKEINRKKIEQAIEELNFKPNNIAKGLRNAQTFAVAVLVPMIFSNFASIIISSIEKHLLPLGYCVIVCECRDDADLEIQKVEFLINRMVDGIIILPYSPSGRQLALMEKHEIPYVVIDQLIHAHPADAVILNNKAAVYNPVLKLIEAGHRDIAILIGDITLFTSMERLDGYRSAMEECHLPIKEAYILNGNYTIEGGYDAVIRLFEQNSPPTALIVSNYEMTIGAVLAINFLKLTIPDDISIIGFDNLPLAKVVSPPLSLVEQPMIEMGKSAAGLLYKRMQGNYENYPEVIAHEASVCLKESVKNIHETD